MAAKLNAKKAWADLRASKIKMDYSNTYTENDHLDEVLEGRLAHIHKAKYRASIGRDESLREAKLTAEKVKFLRDSIRRWHLRNQKEHTSATKANQQRPKTVGFNVPNRRSVSGQTTDGHPDVYGSDGKLFNPLTMFAVSLHKQTTGQFAQNIMKDFEEDPRSRRRTSHCDSLRAQSQETAYEPHRISEFPLQRPQTAGVEVDHDEPIRAKSATYGIGIKRKSSRSLKKLQREFTFDNKAPSKLSDIYEERRKLLLTTETKENDLPDRINAFLKDVDNFTGKEYPVSHIK